MPQENDILRPMPETLEQWRAFVDAEVSAVCERRGWGRQVRRKWAVREKPVAESPIDDYEWKLIPDADGLLPPFDVSKFIDGVDEGRYFVLGVDTQDGAFVLQHDTLHNVFRGRQNDTSTFTRIPFEALRHAHLSGNGDLRDYVLDLVEKFEPNEFLLL